MTYTIFNTFRPYDFGTDAIERQRVALGQSIIDADFEYGLQATKWQIYQDIRKSPSMFEIPGTDFVISSVTTDGQNPSLISSQMTSTAMVPPQMTPASNVIASQILALSTAAPFVYTANSTIVFQTGSHNVTVGQQFPITVTGVVPSAATAVGTVNGTYIATAQDANRFYVTTTSNTFGSFTVNTGFAAFGLVQTVSNNSLAVATNIATVTAAYPHFIPIGYQFLAYIGNVNTTAGVPSTVYSCTSTGATTFVFQTTTKTATQLGSDAGTTQFLTALGCSLASYPGIAAATTGLPTGNTAYLSGLSSYIAGTVSLNFVASQPFITYQNQSWLNNSIPGYTGVYTTSITALTSNLYTIAQYPSYSIQNGTMTVSTPVPHGIVPGTSVQGVISGNLPKDITTTAAVGTINGTYTLTALTANTFTIPYGSNVNAGNSGIVAIGANQILPNTTFTITPANGFATLFTAVPHNLPPASTVQVLVSGVSAQVGSTGSLNGTYTATSIAPGVLAPTTVSILGSAGTATVTFTNPHGLVSGAWIVVYGATAGGYATTTAGAVQITVTSPLTFTYANATTGTLAAIVKSWNPLIPFCTYDLLVTGASSTVTVNTVFPHGFVTGMGIVVKNATTTNGGNLNTAAVGTTLTVTSTTQFTYTCATATAGTAGTSTPANIYIVPAAIASITQTGGTATATFASLGHGLPFSGTQQGGPYYLTTNNFDTQVGYNSNAALITVTSATAFTFPVGSGTASPATTTMGTFQVTYWSNAFSISTSAAGTFSTLNSQTQFLTAMALQIPTISPLAGTSNINVGTLLTNMGAFLPGTPYVSSYSPVMNTAAVSTSSNVAVITFPVQAFSNTSVPAYSPVSVAPPTPIYSQKLNITGISAGSTTATVTLATSYYTTNTGGAPKFIVTIVNASGGTGGAPVGGAILPAGLYNTTQTSINGVYEATWASATTFTIPLATPVAIAYTGGVAYFGFNQVTTNSGVSVSAGVATVTTNLPHFIPIGTSFAYQLTGTAVTALTTTSGGIVGNSTTGIATVTTSASHNLTSNTLVTISGANLTGFNTPAAPVPITVTGAAAFTYVNSTAGTITGTATVTPVINTSNTAVSTGYNTYQFPTFTSGTVTAGGTVYRSALGFTVDNTGVATTGAVNNGSTFLSNNYIVGGGFTSNLQGIVTISNMTYQSNVAFVTTSGGIAGNGTTTTVTTQVSHGLTTGQYVGISGANITGFNGGPYQITVTTPVQFTFLSTVNATTSGLAIITVSSGAFNYFNQTFPGNGIQSGGSIPGGFPVTAYQGLQSNVVNYTGFFNEARNYDRAEGFTILNGIVSNGTFGHIAKGQVSFGTNADRFADTRSAINTSYTVCRRGGIVNNGQGKVQNIARFVQSQLTATSNLVTVTTSIPHGLSPGTPILVTGWSSNVYGVNGSFFTENVYSTTTFTYTPWYGVGGATGVLGFGGSIYVQPYAYVVHRPFDGGVLLSVSVPTYGASVVRQSKKVFRYQSGKGLLWSTGTLFCPNNDLTLASSSGLTPGSTIALVTDIQHGGPQPGALVSIKGLSSTGYNGAYNISNVTNTTTVTLIAPTPTAYSGIALGASSSIAGNGATATVVTAAAHGLVPGSFVAVNNTATFSATATAQTSLPSLNIGTIIAFNCSVLGTSITVGTVLTNTPASTLGISGSPTLTVTGVTPTAVLVTVTGSTFTFTPVAGGVTLTAASGITGTYTTNGTYIVYPIYGAASTTVTQVGVLSNGTVAPAQTMTTAQLASIGIVVPASATMTSATLGTPVNGYVPITIIMSSGGYNIIAGSNIYGATMTTSAGTTLINGTYVTPTQISTSTTVTSPTGTYYYAAGYQYIVTPASLYTMGISNVFGNVLVTNATSPTTTITTTIPSYNLGMSFLTTFGSIVSGMPFNTGTGNYVQVQTVPTTTSFTYNSPANTNSATISSPGGTVISPGQYLISALSANVTAASLTTSGAHNYAVGTRVVLAGFTPSTYNGTYLVQTVPSATTFTIATTVNSVASGLGTATWNGTLTGTLVQATISTISADGLGTSTVTTTSAHNMVTGTVVNVNTGSGGTATFNTLTSPQVITVTSTNTFTYPNPATTIVGGGTVGTAPSVTTYYAQLGNQPRFVINNWQGASVRAGCFDDQNGIFWEYDGQTVYAVKRSSTQQLSGLCALGALGQTVSGDANTRFFDQLRVGDKVTIRGMTYGVSGIQTQNQFTITPPYRGTNSTLFNVKVCRVVETRTPQSQFNRDPVNGTGNSGFTFDLTKMQMIGIQYTWYGAGFIDFMIRGADGNWVYAHRFTNNNNNDEAYMRTGNQPVRYEIINETSTAVSTLAQSMYITDNYFVVNDNPTGFWPSAGTVQIENEFISYSGFTTTVPYTFNVTARAAALNYSVADTGRTFRNGPAASHPMVATNSGVIGQTVNLVSCTCFPALNHWGSAFIMDGQFDQDRGYFFNYTFNQTTPIIAGVAPQALYFLRLAPSASGGTTGDTGTRDLLNRAQLLLSKLDCSAINTVNSGGTLNIQGILNPAGFDTATFNWQSINSAIQGGQPSFCQYALASQVTNGQYVPGTGERIFSLIAIAGAVSTIDLSSLKELAASIPGTNRIFPDGPDTLLIIASAYNQNVNSTTLNLYWSEAQA